MYHITSNPFMSRSYYRPFEYRQRYSPTDYYFVNMMNRLQEMEDFNNYENLVYRLMMQKQKQQEEIELAEYIKKQEEIRRKKQEEIRRKQLEEMRRKKQEEIRRKQLEEMKKREEIERKKLNDEIMKFDEEYARKLQEEEYEKFEKMSNEEENSSNWKPQDELNLDTSNEIEDELPDYIEPEPILDDAQSADPIDLLKFND